jgi:hypothetical protein
LIHVQKSLIGNRISPKFLNSIPFVERRPALEIVV